MSGSHRVEIGITRPHQIEQAFRQRHFVQRIEAQKPCPQAVIYIMGIVGDIVGNGRALRFQTGKSRQFQIIAFVEIENRQRNRDIRMRRMSAQQGAVVLDQPFQRLP